ncbi:MAG: hypothetical protein ABIY52_15155 [Gemmatimonadaceae bacterium]
MVGLLTIGAHASAEAQATTLKHLPRSATPQVSCGPMAMVLLKVVDRAGQVVKDARIEVLRKRDSAKVPVPMEPSSLNGEYTIIDDGSLSMISPRGEWVVVHVRRGKHMASKAFRIRRTDDGCHVRLVSGAPTIVVGR